MAGYGKTLRLRLGFHSAELVNSEQLTHPADALLTKDDRAGRTEPYRDREHGENGREQKDPEECQRQIQGSALRAKRPFTSVRNDSRFQLKFVNCNRRGPASTQPFLAMRGGTLP
jgi:hypothetical protein